MFRVKVYQGKEMAEGCSLALTHRLYIAGWMLNGELKHMRDMSLEGILKYNSKIAIGFLNDVPVVLVLDTGFRLMAFCRKALRRRGYGSQCFAALNTKTTWCDEGIENSRKFWHRNGLRAGYR